MLNYPEIIQRIESIREKNHLNASSFADRIGVPRSSISHILSGRNKPSLEFIIKTVDAFEEVSLDGLLYGKTSLPPDSGMKEISFPETEPAPKEILTPLPESSLQKNAPDTPVYNLEAPSRVIVFYPDGTFETFIPKKP